jgi:hypothetical protein
MTCQKRLARAKRQRSGRQRGHGEAELTEIHSVFSKTG